MGAVGQSVPQDAAREHVRGRSVFLDDMPPVRGELQVSFLGSPVAHGRITRLDTSAALAIPGVAGIWTAADVQGTNVYGPIIEDEYFLAEDHLSFLGEPVAVVAAETQEALHAALLAIVLEVQELPPILTVDEAIAAGEFIGAPREVQRGDAQLALATAPHTLEGTLHIGGQEHLYLETQCAVVHPDERGHLTVHSSTQNPTEAQVMIARVLGLGQHQVVCVCKRMGGGFGGKETQATPPALMAAMAALYTGRPARCVYARATDMQVTGKRHPFQVHYRAGFDERGQLLALKADFYANGGSFADLSTSVLDRALFHADNAYFLPNVELFGRVCRTNLASNTAFRGFGGGQGVIVIENILEEIAQFLGKDASEIRLLNCYGPPGRDITPYGQVVRDDSLPLLYEQLMQRANYGERRRAVGTFNAGNSTHLRGLSLTMVKFGISFTSKFLNQANALVNVYTDGTVQVSTGGTEMGQGLNTKIRQLVADELALPVDKVWVMPTSTEKNNNTPPTAASAGTDLNGSAAVMACRSIRDRLTDLAAERLGAATSEITWNQGRIFVAGDEQRGMSFGELAHVAHRERISLGERAHYATPGLGPSQPFFYFTSGCALAEVEIDRCTGELRVVRLDVLMDIGQSINPAIDKGQISGGFVQGMGWVTCEELRYDESGRLLAQGPYGYKVPSISDVPLEFNVNLVEGTAFPPNVRSSKAVGEPPLLLGLCVWTAVKNALGYAHPGTVPSLQLPATNEAILLSLAHAGREALDSPAWPQARRQAQLAHAQSPSAPPEKSELLAGRLERGTGHQ